ncbi:NACHT C-terminal helical domain 2-containing protein [Pantanalinema rosaneae CENA516]|uniref:NACHT C-terminal helical domain 2-containing protein n=1 Tax=Pantanalinema rosaneae TaxID=1620701 RepID=UPI003D6E1909
MRSLEQLKQELPNPHSQPENWETYKWCQETGSAWAKRLRTAMIEHRNIGHKWQFTKAQWELLQKYYDANQFRIDCLNSACCVSRKYGMKLRQPCLPCEKGGDW